MKRYAIALHLFALSFLIDFTLIRDHTFNLLDELTQRNLVVAGVHYRVQEA